MVNGVDWDRSRKVSARRTKVGKLEGGNARRSHMRFDQAVGVLRTTLRQ